jgi:hypothetical protein
MNVLPITRDEAIAALKLLGAPSDIGTYSLVLAVDAGEAIGRVDFEDGTTVFLDHSRPTTFGIFRGGWDVQTRRAAYVLVAED